MALVYTEDLQLFSAAEVERAIDNQFMVEYLPSSSLKNSNDFISFDIAGDGGKLINLAKTKIKISCRITLKDGSPIATPANNISTVNLTLHSLFSQIQIALNGVSPSQSVGAHYSFKSVLDYLLEKNSDFLESHGTGSGFFKDDIGYSESGIIDAGLNSGSFYRNKMFKDSQVCEMIDGLIGCDLGDVNRLILNGVQVQVKMYQNQDLFRLMNGGFEH